ncbi:MAG: hypothetical protein KDJ76_08850 [Xanthobacteraceae bacterium]|nr:hypothetical protein [Xanthobacteraceae bacterium]
MNKLHRPPPAVKFSGLRLESHGFPGRPLSPGRPRLPGTTPGFVANDIEPGRPAHIGKRTHAGKEKAGLRRPFP